jgi:outer membrane lipoprotein SlyB
MNRCQRMLPSIVCSALLAMTAVPAASAATASQPGASQPATQSDKLAALCGNCAIVSEVKTETRKGQGGALGVVGGAVLGGVLGHQIGGGTGKTLATVGGAAAGAYAGNEVQKNANKTTVWRTRVTLKDGSQRSFENSADPGFKVGEVVLVDSGALRKR